MQGPNLKYDCNCWFEKDRQKCIADIFITEEECADTTSDKEQHVKNTLSIQEQNNGICANADSNEESSISKYHNEIDVTKLTYHQIKSLQYKQAKEKQTRAELQCKCTFALGH